MDIYIYLSVCLSVYLSIYMYMYYYNINNSTGHLNVFFKCDLMLPLNFENLSKQCSRLEL